MRKTINKNNRFARLALTALLAAVLAGASVQLLLSALGLPCGVLRAYLPTLAAAVLCAVGSLGGAAAIVCGAGAVLILGVGIGANIGAVNDLRTWVSALGSGTTADADTMASAARMLALILGVILGAGGYWLIGHRGGTAFALLIAAAILITSYALNPTLSLMPAVPGLIAALTAFAVSGDLPKDSGAWRAILCAALAVGAAFLLTPASGLTWEPLERAAQTVRAVFEDYFQFTKERIPFTISTEGYDHAAEENGDIVAKLGGPANPSTDPVMQVTSDSHILLRGSIRRTYTGNSWTDDDAKARYLYYDFTRYRIRDSVLEMTDNDIFEPVNVSVQFLSEATSTLFVPTRLESFEMDAQNAVYYNSIGEMFLSQEVQPGDSYTLVGRQVGNEQTLREAVAAGKDAGDGDYDDILASCTQLPDGIEQGVYTLAAELTQACDNDYDKAVAIQNWLQENCVYTLTPSYPNDDRDFVSQFVLSEREGYCSYFASAMAVMCRIAGLPSRYVEGYSVDAGQDVVVTGEDAHAWTEVYFKGVGWVSFDPANGGSGNGMDDDDTADRQDGTPPLGSEDTPTPEPQEENTPTPEPQDNSETPTPEPQENLQTPTPDPDTGWFDTPTPETNLMPPENDEHHNLTWLWTILIILLILILLALAYLWIKLRLSRRDPIKLAEAAQDAEQAAMVLYRSILTLLAQTGQSPNGSETPGAFARRTAEQTPNPDFIVFADALSMAVYARAGISLNAVEVGKNAYRAFEKNLKKGERLRYDWVRLTKGLGTFDAIP